MEPGCLVWNLNPVFTLGPLTLHWYGFCFGLGILAGFPLLEWQFKRGGYPLSSDIRLTFFMAGAMLVGAYLFHRLFYEWDRLLQDPLGTLLPTGGVQGLASHGAALGTIFGIFLFARWSRMPFLDVADRATLPTMAVAPFVRLGNLMNSEIVGLPTHMPWSICYPRFDQGNLIPRHPSQIYEIIVCILVLLGLLWADRRFGGERRPSGLLSGLVLTLYFPLRFIAEWFKQPLVMGHDPLLTMGQMLSVPFFLAGVAILTWSLRAGTQTSASSRPGQFGHGT